MMAVTPDTAQEVAHESSQDKLAAVIKVLAPDGLRSLAAFCDDLARDSDASETLAELAALLKKRAERLECYGLS